MNDGDSASFRLTAEISKRDDEMRVAYGWASVIEEGGKVVVDHQGDVIREADLVKAAHHFVTAARTGGVMHIRDSEGKPVKVGEVVESVVMTRDLQKALGVDLGRVGWFIGIKVHHDPTWERVKKGQLRAFSIGGRGIRRKIED